MTSDLAQWGGWLIGAALLLGYWCGRQVEAWKWRVKADALTAKESGGQLYRVLHEPRRGPPLPEFIAADDRGLG